MHFDICFPRYHTGGQEPDSEEHNRILIFPWVTPSQTHSQPYLSMRTYLTVTHRDSDTDSREECLMHISVLLFLHYLQIDNPTQHSYGLFFGAGNLNLHYKCTSGKKHDANVLKLISIQLVRSQTTQPSSTGQTSMWRSFLAFGQKPAFYPSVVPYPSSALFSHPLRPFQYKSDHLRCSGAPSLPEVLNVCINQLCLVSVLADSSERSTPPEHRDAEFIMLVIKDRWLI